MCETVHHMPPHEVIVYIRIIRESLHKFKILNIIFCIDLPICTHVPIPIYNDNKTPEGLNGVCGVSV